jgi:hypothetical protein
MVRFTATRMLGAWELTAWVLGARELAAQVLAIGDVFRRELAVQEVDARELADWVLGTGAQRARGLAARVAARKPVTVSGAVIGTAMNEV